MAQATRVRQQADDPAGRGHHFGGAELLLHARHLRSRHHAAAIIAVAALVVAGIRLFPTQEVTVLSDGQARDVVASFNTSSDGLSAAGVSLLPGDRIVRGGQGDHTVLKVDRAVPVAVTADGRTVQFNTQTKTVQGALLEAGIELFEGDRIYVDGALSPRQLPLEAVRPSERPGSSLAARYAQMSAGPIDLAVVRARPVMVYVEGQLVRASSAAEDVAGVLLDLGLVVLEADLVSPPPDTPVTEGMTVRLARAERVSVVVDGVQQTLYTQAKTVGDVLAVLAGPAATVETVDPPADTVLASGMQIRIALRLVKVVEGEETIPARVVYETDSSLPPGTVKVVPGRDGRKLVRHQVTYVDGKETLRVRLDEDVVLENPVDSRQIAGPVAGTRNVAQPSIDAPDYAGPYTNKLDSVKVTWYNASHGGKLPNDPAYGRTATGVYVDYGICAVDPAVIPLGTLMYIPGYGQCLAADTGGGVIGKIVDLGFPETAGGNPWGTKYLDIYILN